MPRIAINIAAYNEAKNLAPVVERARAHGKVFVVDDGSTDDTAAVASRAGATVLRHPFNLGQGSAIITGFKAALAEGVDIVINMDADGQHNSEEIPVLAEKMSQGSADIVVGSRILGATHADAPLARRLFLPGLTAVINLLTGFKMTDSMCGFRAFRADSLKRALPVLDEMLEPQYLSAEMFIRLSRLGFTVEEVPVHLKDRTTGASTKGMFRYGVGVSRAILGALLTPTRRRDADN